MTSPLTTTVIILLTVFIVANVLANYLPENSDFFGELQARTIGKGLQKRTSTTSTVTPALTTSVTTMTSTTTTTITTTITTTTATVPGRLHADGQWIKDSQGNVAILRGPALWWRWNYPDYSKQYDPLAYPEETEKKYDAIKSMGNNFIRVQLNKWTWDNGPKYVSAVDTLVQWAAQRNMWVVLDFQIYAQMNDGYPTWTKRDQMNYILNGTMQQFMMTLAQRYKNQPNVIGFEIMPEKPNDVTWASYRNITTTQARAEYRQGLISAIRAIHSVDSSYLVFVYPSSNDRLISFIQEAPIIEPNIVWVQMRSVTWDNMYWKYATDYYNGNQAAAYPEMESTYQKVLFAAQNITGAPKYPVMLLETEATTSLPNPTQYVTDLLNIFAKHQVGISWWSADIQPSTTEEVWIFFFNDSNYNLTPLGQAWKQKLLAT